MSPVHLRNNSFQRSQTEDRVGLSRSRRPEREHLGHSGGWKEKDWKDMDEVLQFHELLKDLFEWSMENKRFNLASQWAELGASFQKICLKDLMVITKDWNPTRKFRLLEVRANGIRDNKATIQAIEEQLTQTGHTQIPSGSQGAGQKSLPASSHH
ncbi:hypothetical protein O181_047812 [Austropuccinia psidii MF-1]|uniref:Uncharacterized protein n=1 Tax=Austropuccinia psidii MF-1 TaxID=1389203 RepID=A0A9Q3DYK7_9BASI|nr:hypothetical protein [Austropuccinia psidii MF-1]